MVGTFPLNVQAGSPQYTLTSQITPSSSTTTITITNTDSIDPISNAYYTIQNEDGSKWCTFYVESWTKSESYLPVYTGSCTYTSSNTSDVFPEGSICWCIWCKEYYDSLITPISTVNSEISNINNDISTINNDINTLTPKVDDSFVNAEKVGDTTLRLTRNDGTTVDISFPKGLNVRNVSGVSAENLSAKENELVVIESCTLSNYIGARETMFFIRGGLGYLRNINMTDYSATDVADGYNRIILSPSKKTVTVSGLLYNKSYVYRETV